MEDIIINNDLAINFDKFINENNTLLIYGLIKTGKTSLAKKLAKDYNAMLFHTDHIYNQIFPPREVCKNMKSEEFIKYDYIFCGAVLNIVKQRQNKCILEGCHIAKLLLTGVVDIEENPIIILSNPKINNLENLIGKVHLENSKKDYDKFCEKFIPGKEDKIEYLDIESPTTK